MQITLDITDEKQLQRLEALRGDKSPQEFAATCFEQGLAVAEFRLRQQQAAIEAGKHPLLQFPETRPEFRTVEPAAIEAVLKEKNKEHPVAIEVNRIVSAYMAQLNSYAMSNGNRLPEAVQVIAEAPIQKIALQITLAAVRSAIQKGGKKAA